MTTLKDVAQALGISKSTVSKALSGAEDVSRATRSAVLEKAVELGYTRSFRSGKSPRIAVFISNMPYRSPEDFGWDMILGIRKSAEPAGYQVQLVPLDRQFQLELDYDAYMLKENCCGGIFLGMSLLDPWIHQFPHCQTPAVLYDNHITGNPRVAQIGADNMEGMNLAVEYLQNLGHQKIGYLSSALNSYIYRRRYHAFLHAAESHGLPAGREFTGASEHISDCIQEHLPRLLDLGCTAIMCSHDILAAGVVGRCRDMGIRVPGQLSVMGFDDISLCTCTEPPLSTIQQNRTQLGKSAFYALQALLSGIPIATYLLHPRLICRGSTAAPETVF